jgi:hypothetical protein
MLPALRLRSGQTAALVRSSHLCLVFRAERGKTKHKAPERDRRAAEGKKTRSDIQNSPFLQLLAIKP